MDLDTINDLGAVFKINTLREGVQFLRRAAAPNRRAPAPNILSRNGYWFSYAIRILIVQLQLDFLRVSCLVKLCPQPEPLSLRPGTIAGFLEALSVWLLRALSTFRYRRTGQQRIIEVFPAQALFAVCAQEPPKLLPNLRRASLDLPIPLDERADQVL